MRVYNRVPTAKKRRKKRVYVIPPIEENMTYDFLLSVHQTVKISFQICRYNRVRIYNVTNRSKSTITWVNFCLKIFKKRANH